MNVLWAIWRGVKVVAITVWTVLYFVILFAYAILNAVLDDQNEGARRLPREMWRKNRWM